MPECRDLHEHTYTQSHNSMLSPQSEKAYFVFYLLIVHIQPRRRQK